MFIKIIMNIVILVVVPHFHMRPDGQWATSLAVLLKASPSPLAYRSAGEYWRLLQLGMLNFVDGWMPWGFANYDSHRISFSLLLRLMAKLCLKKRLAKPPRSSWRSWTVNDSDRVSCLGHPGAAGRSQVLREAEEKMANRSGKAPGFGGWATILL